LGGILEVIDGLIECPGRIIIMTTNHKEHLDSALLRPGRIDMEIEFKKLRHCHIAEIYKKWYGKELDLANDIEDYKYTQAEISQLLFKYENDSKGFIREIKINDY
jgi:chaperone BCS1